MSLALLKQGGHVMYPLFIFSVLIWTIAVERFFFLRNFSRNYLRFDKEVRTAIKFNKVDEITNIVKEAPSYIAEPYDSLVTEVYSTREEMGDVLFRRLLETHRELKKRVWVIGTIASSAPFVGLFGTVLGIMESFTAIGSSGKSGFSVVAAGISESLIATASGILVAVVAVVFYNYLQTKIGQVNQDFKIRLEDTAHKIFKAQGA